jgi:hypothetical protein
MAKHPDEVVKEFRDATKRFDDSVAGQELKLLIAAFCKTPPRDVAEVCADIGGAPVVMSTDEADKVVKWAVVKRREHKLKFYTDPTERDIISAAHQRFGKSCRVRHAGIEDMLKNVAKTADSMYMVKVSVLESATKATPPPRRKRRRRASSPASPDKRLECEFRSGGTSD